jgi:phenylalanine-4-hydroxylase
MAVGKKVISAFSGPADVTSFDLISHVPSSTTIKAKYTLEREELEGLYQAIRNIREGRPSLLSLESVFDKVKQNHPNDWLLSLEIAELFEQNSNEEKRDNVLNYLEKMKLKRPEVSQLISNGIDLVFRKVMT